MAIAISETKKFIFIHIAKTAGQSVYNQLKPFVKKRKFGVHGDPNPHEQANRLRRVHFEETFDQYFSFSFVRNPWARLYSYYHYIRRHYPKHKPMYKKIREFRGGTPLDTKFNDWIIHCEFYDRKSPGVIPVPIQRRNQLDWLTDANYERIIVNYVGKVETINTDWKVICRKINIPYRPMRRLNKTKHDDYRKAYNQKAIDFVAEHFKRDIETFGYKFDE